MSPKLQSSAPYESLLGLVPFLGLADNNGDAPTLATESSGSAETPATPSKSSPPSEGPPKDFSQEYQLHVVTNEAATSVITGRVTNAETKSFHSCLRSQVRWMINTGGGHVTGGPSDGNIVLFQTRVGVDF